MRTSLLLLSFLALTLAGCSSATTAVKAGADGVAAAGKKAPAGDLATMRGSDPVSARDLIPPMLEGEHYSDKYTFEFTLGEAPDTYALYFSVFITNLGPGQHKAQIRSRIVTPTGERLTHSKKVDGGRWTSASDRLALAIGAYRLSGTPEALTMHAQGEDYAFDLQITPDVAPWRPPQGTITLRSDPTRYFHTVYTAPRSHARGTVTIKGKSLPLEGYGYGIHSVSNIAPYELSWRWLGFRSVQRDYTVFFRQLVTPKADGKREEAFLVIGGPKGLRFSSKDIRVALDNFTPDSHKNAYGIPGKVVLHARSGEGANPDEAQIIFKADELRSRSEPLKNLNAFVRMMAEQFTKPVNLEYYAPFAARVKVDGVWHEFEGRGNYEINFLNK